MINSKKVMVWLMVLQTILVLYLISEASKINEPVSLISKPTVINIVLPEGPPIKIEPIKNTDIKTEKEKIDGIIEEISKKYNVDASLIKAMVKIESNYCPTVINKAGDSGLMQINKKWHSERMSNLGVVDLLSPRQNILVGVDYVSELLKNNESKTLAIMKYNMGHKKATELYNSGKVSKYIIKLRKEGVEI